MKSSGLYLRLNISRILHCACLRQTAVCCRGNAEEAGALLEQSLGIVKSLYKDADDQVLLRIHRQAAMNLPSMPQLILIWSLWLLDGSAPRSTLPDEVASALLFD